jgi:hypothetical protein
MAGNSLWAIFCRAVWHGADELVLIEDWIVFYAHSFEAM